MDYGVTTMPPISGSPGVVSVLLPEVMTVCVLPMLAVDRSTVQFSRLVVPLQVAAWLVAPCVKLTVVPRLVPLTVNGKLLLAPPVLLILPGLRLLTRGKLEL